MKSHKFDLAALKAKGLPRCTYDALVAALGMTIRPADGASPEEVAVALAELRLAVDLQVAPFIPPQKECLGCGSILAGDNMVDAYLRATFTYGLAHGEGHCRNCGYPARANHYAPKDGAGLTFRRVLQYHPDELIERQPATSEASR
jgi:hypothetical protein